MAINFPNTPIDGNTYDYGGIRYTYADTGGGTGYWRVTTPGTAGIASAAEISAGADLVKYLTSKGFADSQYPTDIASKLAASSFTASAILTLLKTVDGAGSGLDADLLDGQSSTYYRSATNLNAGTVNVSRLPIATTTVRGVVKLPQMSNGSNGYFYDRNSGFCIQWGEKSCGANTVNTITLPIAYANHRQAYASYNTTSIGEVDPPGAVAHSATQIKVTNSMGATRLISWLSVGHI